MIFKIEVTQEDIDMGEQCSASRCPVAIATRRAMGADLIHANCSGIKGYGSNPERWFFSTSIPLRVAQFMHRFDRSTLGVAPFLFEIEVNDALLKGGVPSA